MDDKKTSSNGFFNLKFNTDNTVKKAIYGYDITGRMVHQRNGVTTDTYRFGESLKSGIYFVNLTLGDKAKLFRVIKY